MANKYLLCKPGGGFNDTLTAIYAAYQYSRKYNRILLIDMRNNHIRHSFDECWSFINSYNIIYNNNEIEKIIKDNTFKNIKCSVTNISNYVDYEEELIVYQTGWLGNGFLTLQLLTINDFILDYIEIQYKKISKPYLSMHIRNTDYKTNYVQFYEENKNIINEHENVFLASDSLEAINFFKSKKNNLYSFIQKIDNTGKPVHMHMKNDKQTVIDMLCDLILLSLSDTFIYPKHCRGFTILAANLFKNKNTLHILTKNRFK